MASSVVHYGVVLAGGRSSRMGQDKASLKIDNVSLLDRAYACLRNTGCQQVWISRNLPGYLNDQIPNGGPLSGIHAALGEILNEGDSSNQYLTVLPVDLPLLRADLIMQLQAAAVASKGASYFSQSYLPLVLPVKPLTYEYCSRALNGAQSASVRGLLAALQAQAIDADVGDQLTNTNTPERWQQAVASSQSSQ